MSSFKQEMPKTQTSQFSEHWIEPIDDTKTPSPKGEKLPPLFVPIEMLSTLKPVLKRSVAVLTSPLPSPSS